MCCLLLSALLPSERMLGVARAHWTIENQLTGCSTWPCSKMPPAPARITPPGTSPDPEIALNTLRHPDKGSIKTKIKRAA